jgi:crotonobetainyl-CoA:carnitine CoA-transferase CaiB-like acyl-CoA transferase
MGDLPLAGLRVVEFVHMVMGPSCGLILGDLGADVIKVEPVPAGDNTRRLTSSGSGFFVAFNRNKRSFALDMKSAEGLEIARKLVAIGIHFVQYLIRRCHLRPLPQVHRGCR